jgi:hypothetical protein
MLQRACKKQSRVQTLLNTSIACHLNDTYRHAHVNHVNHVHRVQQCSTAASINTQNPEEWSVKHYAFGAREVLGVSFIIICIVVTVLLLVFPEIATQHLNEHQFVHIENPMVLLPSDADTINLKTEARAPSTRSLHSLVCFNMSITGSWIGFMYWFMPFGTQNNLSDYHIKSAIVDAFGCRHVYNEAMCNLRKNTTFDITVKGDDLRHYGACIGSINQRHSDEITDVIESKDFFKQLIRNGLPSLLSLSDVENIPWQRSLPLSLTDSQLLSPCLNGTDESSTHVFIDTQYVANNPNLDDAYDFFVWQNVPFTLEFSSTGGALLSDAVFFVKFGERCPNNVQPKISVLNADLQTVITLPAGIYQLCIQQGSSRPTKHKRIRAIANYRPGSGVE